MHDHFKDDKGNYLCKARCKDCGLSFCPGLRDGSIKGIAKALCGGKKAEDKDAETEEDVLRKKPSVGEVDVEAKPLLRNDSVSGA